MFSLTSENTHKEPNQRNKVLTPPKNFPKIQLNFEEQQQQQNMTPFSKFINGLSPISKISKEAAQEISNFKNVQGSIYANQQKLNDYLQTPSPSMKSNQISIDQNRNIPNISNNLIQKLNFNDYSQINNNITIVNISSPIINLNCEQDQQIQNNDNDKNNNNMDLANLMYECKFVQGKFKNSKIQQNNPTENEGSENYSDDSSDNSLDDSQFFDKLELKNQENQEENQLKNQEKINRNLNFDKFETPKQSKDKKITKMKMFELINKQDEINLETLSQKAIQKTAQLSEKLNISLSKVLTKNQDSCDNITTQKKKLGCNCKKSKCLKLYCECFANGKACTKDCNCYDCSNTDDNEDIRYQVMLQLIERNPCAFKPKVDKTNQQQSEQHLRGCNCNKSGCIKKYCECYQAGVKCTSLCKCEHCKNQDCTEIKSEHLSKCQLMKNHQRKEICQYEKPIIKKTRNEINNYIF